MEPAEFSPHLTLPFHYHLHHRLPMSPTERALLASAAHGNTTIPTIPTATDVISQGPLNHGVGEALGSVQRTGVEVASSGMPHAGTVTATPVAAATVVSGGGETTMAAATVAFLNTHSPQEVAAVLSQMPVVSVPALSTGAAGPGREGLADVVVVVDAAEAARLGLEAATPRGPRNHPGSARNNRQRHDSRTRSVSRDYNSPSRGRGDIVHGEPTGGVTTTTTRTSPFSGTPISLPAALAIPSTDLGSGSPRSTHPVSHLLQPQAPSSTDVAAHVASSSLTNSGNANFLFPRWTNNSAHEDDAHTGDAAGVVDGETSSSPTTTASAGVVRASSPSPPAAVVVVATTGAVAASVGAGTASSYTGSSAGAAVMVPGTTSVAAGNHPSVATAASAPTVLGAENHENAVFLPVSSPLPADPAELPDVPTNTPPPSLTELPPVPEGTVAVVVSAPRLAAMVHEAAVGNGTVVAGGTETAAAAAAAVAVAAAAAAAAAESSRCRSTSPPAAPASLPLPPKPRRERALVQGRRQRQAARQQQRLTFSEATTAAVAAVTPSARTAGNEPCATPQRLSAAEPAAATTTTTSPVEASAADTHHESLGASQSKRRPTAYPNNVPEDTHRHRHGRGAPTPVSRSLRSSHGGSVVVAPLTTALVAAVARQTYKPPTLLDVAAVPQGHHHAEAVEGGPSKASANTDRSGMCTEGQPSPHPWPPLAKSQESATTATVASSSVPSPGSMSRAVALFYAEKKNFSEAHLDSPTRTFGSRDRLNLSPTVAQGSWPVASRRGFVAMPREGPRETAGSLDQLTGPTRRASQTLCNSASSVPGMPFFHTGSAASEIAKGEDLLSPAAPPPTLLTPSPPTDTPLLAPEAVASQHDIAGAVASHTSSPEKENGAGEDRAHEQPAERLEEHWATPPQHATNSTEEVAPALVSSASFITESGGSPPPSARAPITPLRTRIATGGAPALHASLYGRGSPRRPTRSAGAASRTTTTATTPTTTTASTGHTGIMSLADALESLNYHPSHAYPREGREEEAVGEWDSESGNSVLMRSYHRTVSSVASEDLRRTLARGMLIGSGFHGFQAHSSSSSSAAHRKEWSTVIAIAHARADAPSGAHTPTRPAPPTATLGLAFRPGVLWNSPSRNTRREHPSFLASQSSLAMPRVRGQPPEALRQRQRPFPPSTGGEDALEPMALWSASGGRVSGGFDGGASGRGASEAVRPSSFFFTAESGLSEEEGDGTRGGHPALGDNGSFSRSPVLRTRAAHARRRSLTPSTDSPMPVVLTTTSYATDSHPLQQRSRRRSNTAAMNASAEALTEPEAAHLLGSFVASVTQASVADGSGSGFPVATQVTAQGANAAAGDEADSAVTESPSFGRSPGSSSTSSTSTSSSQGTTGPLRRQNTSYQVQLLRRTPPAPSHTHVSPTTASRAHGIYLDVGVTSVGPLATPAASAPYSFAAVPATSASPTSTSTSTPPLTHARTSTDLSTFVGATGTSSAPWRDNAGARDDGGAARSHARAHDNTEGSLQLNPSSFTESRATVAGSTAAAVGVFTASMALESGDAALHSFVVSATSPPMRSEELHPMSRPGVPTAPSPDRPYLSLSEVGAHTFPVRAQDTRPTDVHTAYPEEPSEAAWLTYSFPLTASAEPVTEEMGQGHDHHLSSGPHVRQVSLPVLPDGSTLMVPDPFLWPQAPRGRREERDAPQGDRAQAPSPGLHNGVAGEEEGSPVTLGGVGRRRSPSDLCIRRRNSDTTVMVCAQWMRRQEWTRGLSGSFMSAAPDMQSVVSAPTILIVSPTDNKTSAVFLARSHFSSTTSTTITSASSGSQGSDRWHWAHVFDSSHASHSCHSARRMSNAQDAAQSLTHLGLTRSATTAGAAPQRRCSLTIVPNFSKTAPSAMATTAPAAHSAAAGETANITELLDAAEAGLRREPVPIVPVIGHNHKGASTPVYSRPPTREDADAAMTLTPRADPPRSEPAGPLAQHTPQQQEYHAHSVASAVTRVSRDSLMPPPENSVPSSHVRGSVSAPVALETTAAFLGATPSEAADSTHSAEADSRPSWGGL